MSIETNPPDNGLITYADKKLWGMAGGQLEYVGQRIEWRSRGPNWVKIMIIRFTDHDMRAFPLVDHKELIDGKYYEIEFPLEG